ncbi:hypothetical protein ACHAXT_005640 [Thalassiosira profunda]
MNTVSTSGKATASMWLGIVGIFIFGIAIVLGVSAKKEIAAKPDERRELLRPTLALAVEIASLIIWLVIVIIAVSQ